MKGIIFTEFLDFIETQSGYETVDHILQRVDPPSGGAYTAVGNYDFSEMSDLLEALSRETGRPVPELLRTYGRHLCERYVSIYPQFFDDAGDLFDFLETIEERIHTDVLKLYPDAQLPSLKTERPAPDRLILHYRSQRPLGELCLGVIEGCASHFDVPLDIDSQVVAEGLDITITRRDGREAAQPSEAEALS